MTDPTPHFDVLIVGAGLSGIGAAYHLQARSRGRPTPSSRARAPRRHLGPLPVPRASARTRTCTPWATRSARGPTQGHRRRPVDPRSTSATPREAFGIDGTSATGTRSSARAGRASTRGGPSTLRDAATGELRELTCGFLYMCAGYYDYDAGYTPEFPGRERFQGRVVHPQQWTEDVDYEGKRVVVIGSGATAVTLVPELAKRAAHVTMLQRSPTYVVNDPRARPRGQLAAGALPERVGLRRHPRCKNVLRSMAFYNYCRRFPEQAKRFLVGEVRRSSGPTRRRAALHPRYKPWDQRVCLVPDGDLFESAPRGRASVVTDHIETFTETGMRLARARSSRPTSIVTATGLKLKFLGGASWRSTAARRSFARDHGLQGHDVQRRAQPRHRHRLHQRVVDAQVRPHLRVRLPPAQPHGPPRLHRRCRPPQRRPRGEGCPLLDFTSGYVLRDIAASPGRARASRGACTRTTPSTG
jgi:monooxygenase